MPLDPPFDATDSQSWQLNRAPLRITVRPYPPPNASPDNRVAPDGVDDWIVPGKAFDGFPDDWIVPGKVSGDGFPDDWIVPGKARDDGFPDDWIVPSPSAPVNAGQLAPIAQPNASNTGFANPLAGPVGNASAATVPDLPFFSNLPASTPPFAPPIPPRSWPPTLSADSSPAPAWQPSQSLLAGIADLQNPISAAPENGGLLGQLSTFSPSIGASTGLFPYPGEQRSTNNVAPRARSLLGPGMAPDTGGQSPQQSLFRNLVSLNGLIPRTALASAKGYSGINLPTAFHAGSVDTGAVPFRHVGDRGNGVHVACIEDGCVGEALLLLEALELARLGYKIYRNRTASQPVSGPYGDLSGALPRGWQANHLNQNAVYRDAIPRNEGLAVVMRGNAITDVGTPHYAFHQSLEQFWNPYRYGGKLHNGKPTNAEYGQALERALVAGGFSPAQASELAAQAAAQRAEYKLSETAPVPRIPRKINRRREDAP